ncbi:MAG: hypothetical protein J1F11_06645 [Oscillospiraceae bacterium]|nr:hypothetical protein [Oscillospiraceae bacterium]
MKTKKFLAISAAVIMSGLISTPVSAETDPFTTYPVRIEQKEKNGFDLSDNILTKTDKSGTYGYTGKVKIGGKTKFYDNGIRWTGWRKIKDKWYYFDPDNDGIMAEGKAKTSLGYYYLDEDGAWNGKLSKSAKYPDDFDFMMSDYVAESMSGCEINTFEGLIKVPDMYNDDHSRKIKLSKKDKQIFYDVIMNCNLSEIKDGLYWRYLYEINADSFGEDESVAGDVTDANEYTTKFTANGKTYEIHGGYEMYWYYSYENSTEVRDYAYFLAFARRYIRDTPQYAEIAEANQKARDKINEEEWGLTLTAKDVTKTGCTLVFTQSGGTAERLSTGFYYSLQRFENGQWTQVRMLPQEYDVAWSRVELPIEENGSAEYKENWQSLYGELRKGQYRIVKEVMDYHKAGDNDIRMFCAYFEI